MRTTRSRTTSPPGSSGSLAHATSSGSGTSRQRLVQACATTVAVVAVLAASTRTEPPAPPAAWAVREAPLWEAGWSERFPGCVAMVLWPRGERPAAFVIRSPDGAVHRLTVGTERRVPLDDRVVGACR